MKLEQVIAIFILLLVPISLVYVDALQQSAPEIIVDISPGDTQNVTWGLKSDKENEITSVEVRAEGEGSEFLSFRKNIELEPQQTLWTIITVSVPADYPGGIELKPQLFATEFQPMEGQISFNIVMAKIVNLNIAPNDDPSLRVDWDAIKKVGVEETVGTESEPPSAEDEGSEQTQGGCLIATATFGSELSPQVQLLREIRDNIVLQTKSGDAFMTAFNQIYYSFSPTIADWERQNPAFKELVKLTITPMITSLSILDYVDIETEAQMLGWGLSIIALNLTMYVVAPTIGSYKMSKYLRNRK